jgi:hypothetical protein
MALLVEAAQGGQGAGGGGTEASRRKADALLAVGQEDAGGAQPAPSP